MRAHKISISARALREDFAGTGAALSAAMIMAPVCHRPMAVSSLILKAGTAAMQNPAGVGQRGDGHLCL